MNKLTGLTYNISQQPERNHTQDESTTWKGSHTRWIDNLKGITRNIDKQPEQ